MKHCARTCFEYYSCLNNLHFHYNWNCKISNTLKNVLPCPYLTITARTRYSLWHLFLSSSDAHHHHTSAITTYLRRSLPSTTNASVCKGSQLLHMYIHTVNFNSMHFEDNKQKLESCSYTVIAIRWFQPFVSAPKCLIICRTVSFKEKMEELEQ